MNIRRITATVLILLGILAYFVNIGFANGNKTVYIIPVKGEITPAMADFLVDKISQANSNGAQGIIIEITTLGGRVDSAFAMKSAILNSEAPVVVHVQERAISAGALITISADTIIMAPGSQVGAAEPRPFDEKTVAVIRGDFGSTADVNGRDPIIAEAMVDKNIEIQGLVEKGALLSLKATTAKEYGYADAILSSRSEVLEFMGWNDANIVDSNFNFKMQIAQFLTSYYIAPLLLTIGLIAIAIEIFTSGFGIAGVIGIISFTLYFGGNVIAGNTQWWSVALFVLGLGLFIGEIIAPGFGILGISGIIAIVASIVFSAPDPGQGLFSLVIAFIGCAVVIPIFFKFFERSPMFKHIVLTESVIAENDHVNVPDNNNLTGKTGKSVTSLHPSGIVIVDGVRLDVVTTGEFIPPDTIIRIIKVEGSRIVVAENT